MKNKTQKFAAIALSSLMLTGALAGCNEGNKSSNNAKSMVKIDVNPSVSLVLDGKDKVISVKSENEDAKVMLYGENLIGLTAEAATKKIAELAVDLDYLNEDNHGISVTAQGKINSDELEKNVESSFQSAVTAAGKNFNINVSSDGLFSLNRELKQVNAKYNLNLTIGEYELILEAQAADNTLTFEAASNLDTDELLEIINKNIDETAEKIESFATETYLAVKNEAYNTYYRAKEELMNKIWTAPYYSPSNIITNKYTPNNGIIYNMYSTSAVIMESGIWAAEKVEAVAEQTEIPEELVDRIANKLEMDPTEFKNNVKDQDGKITLKSLETYLNKVFKNMTAEERAAAQAKYDEIMDLVKTKADEIDGKVNAEIEVKLGDIVANLQLSLDASKEIDALNVYIKEFSGTIEKMKKAMEGKDKLPAARAALQELEKAKERIMNDIKNQLDENDLNSVKKAEELAEKTFAQFEETMNNAITRAEQTAKDYLNQLKEARKNNK